jgi:hypothetical protein
MRSTLAIAAAALVLAGCSESRNRTADTVTQPPAIRVAGALNEIPAGTELEVLTNEPINSSSGEGRTYAAQIATDVVGADGRVLLPKGSEVELVLLEAKEGGGITGPKVQLGMRSVTVNGTTYLAVSEDVTKTGGLGANERTAHMVGGGAALGAAIGAVASGGKGAVIGGLIGAAAGAAAQVLTQGKELQIPAETLLTFKLDEPIQLRPTR